MRRNGMRRGPEWDGFQEYCWLARGQDSLPSSLNLPFRKTARSPAPWSHRHPISASKISVMKGWPSIRPTRHPILYRVGLGWWLGCRRPCHESVVLYMYGINYMEGRWWD